MASVKVRAGVSANLSNTAQTCRHGDLHLYAIIEAYCTIIKTKEFDTVDQWSECH
jgi:hypothetical protein